MQIAFFASTGESSGLSVLGINGQAFLVQLVTFLLFIVLLEKLAVKPLLRRLNARRKIVDDGVTLGLELRQQKAHLDEEISKALQAARSDADHILEEGRRSATAAIKAAETAAREKAEGIISEAAERIKVDAVRARADLEDDIATLVGDVAEAVISEKLTGPRDAAFIKKTVREQLSV